MPIPPEFREAQNSDGMPFCDLQANRVAELLAAVDGDELLVLDVRTQPEHESHRLAAATLIPVQELAARHDELDPATPTLVYCEHGIRSVQAAVFLAQLGFDCVFNLRGGIVTWQGSLEGRNVPPGRRATNDEDTPC